MKLTYSLAAPFAYETGFYFNGKKSYHVKALAVLSLLGIIFLIYSFVVLFGPVMSGSVIYTTFEVAAFNTRANLPQDLTTPSSMS
jgi:hypothetical protein